MAGHDRRQFLNRLGGTLTGAALAACGGGKDVTATPSSPAASAVVVTPAPPPSPGNPAMLYSPYNWLVQGGVAKTINPGAYFRTLFTGSTCRLSFDTSNLSTPPSRIRIKVDGQTDQIEYVADSINVRMPATAGTAPHTLEVMFIAVTESGSRWSPQNSCLRLTGISLASPSDVLTAPPRKPKTLLAYGDSITEAVRVLGLGNTGLGPVDAQDAGSSYAIELGRILNAEVGVVGFGGTGLNNQGVGQVPALSSTWAQLWAGQPRSFSVPPDYCTWVEGTNDGGSDTTANGHVALDGMLNAMPRTKFGIFRPFNGSAQAANLQAIVAGCADRSRVAYIDTEGYWSPSDSYDGLHPNAASEVTQIAPKMAAALVATFG